MCSRCNGRNAITLDNGSSCNCGLNNSESSRCENNNNISACQNQCQRCNNSNSINILGCAACGISSAVFRTLRGFDRLLCCNNSSGCGCGC